MNQRRSCNQRVTFIGAVWDMQPEPNRRIQNRGEEGTLYVPAGTYKVTVTVGKDTQTVPLVVLPYPYNRQAPIPPGR